LSYDAVVSDHVMSGQLMWRVFNVHNVICFIIDMALIYEVPPPSFLPST